MNGGTLVTVPFVVKDNEWTFDPEIFRSKLSEKTKLMILNSPHNPTGKCFTLEELNQITEVLIDFPNIVVISDEVYDFLTFDGLKHIPFASLGNNWHRTISVYSGGKKMCATGWKVGWGIGPARIIKLVAIISNTISYSTNTPAQVAMSECLPMTIEQPADGSLNFIDQTRKNFSDVRDLLVKEISEMPLPWEPLPCRSGYFLMVDISKCKHLIPSIYLESHDYDGEDSTIPKNRIYMPGSNPPRIPLDLAFVRWMGKENGVTMMPNCFFYHPKSQYMSENFVRVAICKPIDSVRKVCERLRSIQI